MMDLGSKSTVTYGAGGEIIVTTTSCYSQEDTLHALKTAESMPRSAFGKGCLKSMGWDDRSRCRDRDWVLVKEFILSYHNSRIYSKYHGFLIW